MVVRNPSKARSALALHGLPTDAAEVFEADLTDHDRLRASLAGVDGLIHAGAVFSLDLRHARAMRDVNPASTAAILGEATDQGLNRIIHVSSMGVYAPSLVDIVPESPVGPESGAYTGSKIAADDVAVALQEAGHPVVVVCPSTFASSLRCAWGPCPEAVRRHATCWPATSTAWPTCWAWPPNSPAAGFGS